MNNWCVVLVDVPEGRGLDSGAKFMLWSLLQNLVEYSSFPPEEQCVIPGTLSYMAKGDWKWAWLVLECGPEKLLFQSDLQTVQITPGLLSVPMLGPKIQDQKSYLTSSK